MSQIGKSRSKRVIPGQRPRIVLHHGDPSKLPLLLGGSCTATTCQAEPQTHWKSGVSRVDLQNTCLTHSWWVPESERSGECGARPGHGSGGCQAELVLLLLLKCYTSTGASRFSSDVRRHVCWKLGASRFLAATDAGTNFRQGDKSIWFQNHQTCWYKRRSHATVSQVQ